VQQKSCYSITSSARSGNAGGIVNPMALAISAVPNQRTKHHFSDVPQNF